MSLAVVRAKRPALKLPPPKPAKAPTETTAEPLLYPTLLTEMDEAAAGAVRAVQVARAIARVRRRVTMAVSEGEAVQCPTLAAKSIN
jgi:hypothetical protein